MSEKFPGTDAPTTGEIMSDIDWKDGNPPVERGGIGYFLVVTQSSPKAFGAHYLNEYLLMPRDDCPSASVENDFTPCQSCENGDGHPFTGWYEEKEDFDGEVFMPLNLVPPHSVFRWAEMPVNPFTPFTREVKDE